MEKVQLNLEANNLYEGFDISEERGEELNYQCRLILHEAQKPQKNINYVQINSCKIIQKFIDLAENENERIFLAFIAGNKDTELRSKII